MKLMREIGEGGGIGGGGKGAGEQELLHFAHEWYSTWKGCIRYK